MQKAKKEKGLFLLKTSPIRKCILSIGVLLMTSLFPLQVLATVILTGTDAQKTQLAQWLTSSLGTNVTVNPDGTLAIADGGNASATRLREMINDANVTVTIRAVENDPNVNLGRWNSSTADPKGPTTGTQDVDLGDIAGIGNILNSYGLTPDNVLMHEITEVYHGVKHGTNFEPAHAEALKAEKELMGEHGTELIFRRMVRAADGTIYGYLKIKRPDGSFVIVRFDLGQATLDAEWFTEATPCTFEPNRLIAIADPDPQVHFLNYNYNLEHAFSGVIDTTNSRPTGVAFDARQNIYTTENFEDGQDEIRVFDPAGNLISSILDERIINPEGIDIDLQTGDIFVAAQDRILRFNSEGTFVGSYTAGEHAFNPTDVSVWRNYSTGEIRGDGSVYAIFVTDKASNQVYRFNIDKDMNHGTYVNAFGSDQLSAPEGIQVDDWWTVWVASTGNNRVYAYTPSGNPESFGSTPYFLEDSTMKIYDVAKVRDEGLYVLDGTPGKGKLVLYDFDATLVKTYRVDAVQCPKSLAVSFALDMDNLVSMPDPGTDEVTEEEKGFPLAAIIAIAVVIALLLIYFVMRRKR